MPLYEYHCSKCDKTIEVIRRFSDPPLTEHEECGGTLERLLSAPAFQLKGTGWYLTDYGKGGTKPAPASDGKSGETKSAESKDSDSKSESKSTSEKSGDKSTESKAETKTEPKPAATPSPAKP
jgi:putative FmdB family regulatory protein